MGFAVGILPLGLAAILSVAAVRDHAAQSAGRRSPAHLSGRCLQRADQSGHQVRPCRSAKRPFVHALPESEKDGTAHPSDNNLSFYSSHTSMAFSMAVAAGTVATMRGYRAAPYVWALGVPLAFLAGYLRVAADRHYLSDVLVGAAVGSAFGALTPWLMHRPGKDP